LFNSLGTVKAKTYAPPKGGVGTNNVELSEESDADLLDQHDTTENEDIVLTEVSDNVRITGPSRYKILMWIPPRMPKLCSAPGVELLTSEL
jgi:hypothetical protein